MKLTFFVVESVGNFPPNGWYQFKMDSPKHVNTKDVARLKANSLLWLLTNDIPGPRSFHFFGQPQSRKPSSTAAEENQTSRHRIKVTGYLPAEFGQILLLGNLLFFDGFLLVGWLVLQKCQTQIRKKTHCLEAPIVYDCFRLPSKCVEQVLQHLPASLFDLSSMIRSNWMECLLVDTNPGLRCINLVYCRFMLETCTQKNTIFQEKMVHQKIQKKSQLKLHIVEGLLPFCAKRYI